MNISETYDYLTANRRKVWAALEALPDDVLALPLLQGERFHSIKDLVLHIAIVEDGWVNLDIREREPVLKRFPELEAIAEGPMPAHTPLVELLRYWQAVEENTLNFLPTLTDADLGRAVTPEDWRGLQFTVDGLLWHVAIHEMRHTAQIAALLRTQGIQPPTLDLLFYLADREIKRLGGAGL